MTKKSIITIAGSVGSGKSSAARGVAEKLGYEHYSGGDFMRTIAERRGVSIEELNILAQNDDGEIDKAVDAQNTEVGEKDNIVIDSRLGYHFIPESFKVFLSIDTRLAAERIFQHIQEEGRASQTATSVEELVKNTEERYASEKKRYMQYYNFDVTDLSPFDLIIDTSKKPLDAVTEEILQGYNTWREN